MIDARITVVEFCSIQVSHCRGNRQKNSGTIPRFSQEIICMNTTELQFLKDLLHAPSPSGYERPVQDVVRAYASRFTSDVRTDWHGNVIVAVNPLGFPRIMLKHESGHH